MFFGCAQAAPVDELASEIKEASGIEAFFPSFLGILAPAGLRFPLGRIG